MPNLQDLKSMVVMKHLTEPMLKKIVPITNLEEYNAGEYIFKAGQQADHLFSLLDGGVDLEIDMGETAPIHLHGIVQYFTFGISALVDTEVKKYIISAKTLEKSKIYKWKASELVELFEDDHEMGYLFMKNVARVLQSRFTAKDELISEFYNFLQSGR